MGIATIGVLAVLSTCGIFSYYLVLDELAGRDAQGSVPAPSQFVPRDISSREADPEPLTVDEVFPDDEVVINPAEPPYQVLSAQASDDCTVAAADALAALLVDLDCSQVVRATLRSPTDGYLVTSGIVNLVDQAAAEQAYEDIKPILEDGTGRFLGMLAGDGTEPIVLSETVLFWDYRGHYLMYAVIARADGEPFDAADNRFADLISWDLIEVHLRGNVLEARAVEPNPELAEVPEVSEESVPEAEDGADADADSDGGEEAEEPTDTGPAGGDGYSDSGDGYSGSGDGY